MKTPKKNQEENQNLKKTVEEQKIDIKDLYNVTEAPKNMPENVTGKMKIMME